ncbi:MAG TPA: TlpA disulfide reductase family protein, partial [Steroidobacteraceae bacterium]|nr:TlpA disulfide reductase family protein [Steroidobacteraceae bacterium]
MKFASWLRAAAFATTLAVTSLVGASASIAPSFSLPSRSGDTVTLDKLKGQVVMINFWASWCGPCRTEMPLLDQMYKRYSPLGFTLIGVNVEPDSKDAEKL